MNNHPKYEAITSSLEIFTTDNGREMCQWLFDQGCLPNQTKRPSLDDKFNPLMMITSALGVEVIYKGKVFRENTSIPTTNNKPKQAPQPKPMSTPQAQPTNTAAELMQQAIQQLVSSSAPSLDETRVLELINEAIDKQAPRRVEIVIPNLPSVVVDKQHYNFEKLIKIVNRRLNTLLIGEAGSGKSSAARRVAEVLGLDYGFISVGMTTTKTEFFGYTDAQGRVVETEFRKRFINGGVFLVDEFDAGNPNVSIALNEPLANGFAAFPDGVFEKHPDFVCIAAANTYGNGATAEFTGRNALDKATLDRFTFLDWNIDNDFEKSIVSDHMWLDKVVKIRKAFKDLNIKQPVSTRAAIIGSTLLADGFNTSEVMEMTIFKGLNETTKNQVLSRI
jgi:midasin (ATPase involved in ribosome maturation)